MNGRKTVANSWGRAPLTRQKQGHHERKGKRGKLLEESSVAREQDRSMDTVDGQEKMGNIFRRAALGGGETEA